LWFATLSAEKNFSYVEQTSTLHFNLVFLYFFNRKFLFVSETLSSESGFKPAVFIWPKSSCLQLSFNIKLKVSHLKLDNGIVVMGLLRIKTNKHGICEDKKVGDLLFCCELVYFHDNYSNGPFPKVKECSTYTSHKESYMPKNLNTLSLGIRNFEHPLVYKE